MKKLIENIDLSKSSALEDLSTRLLRDAFKLLTLELTHIYIYIIPPSKLVPSRNSPLPETLGHRYSNPHT